MDDQLPQIGQQFDESDPPPVFELVISDHVPFVNPLDYNVTDANSIDPARYFVTSGDAVEKTKILEKNLWDLAGKLRKKCYTIIASENSCTEAKAQELYRDGIFPKYPPRLHEYESAIWKAAGACRKLSHALLKAKGPNVFLETEWNNHKLYCIPKNPRSKTE